MVISIRPAQCDDVQAIASVQVASWNTTYRGLGIDDFLKSVTVERRAEIWGRALCGAESKTFLHVATDDQQDGQIVGFSAAGPERSGDSEYPGELYTLYLLEAYQRKGIGRQLVQAVAARLSESGFKAMLIWVLAVNPARFFYEACGGQAVRQQDIEFGGKTFVEIGYGWQDLNLK